MWNGTVRPHSSRPSGTRLTSHQINGSESEGDLLILSFLLPQPLPGCERYAFGSDDYWECYVRHMGTSYIHPCGTCKMGPLEDPTSVLDENLKYER